MTFFQPILSHKTCLLMLKVIEGLEKLLSSSEMNYGMYGKSNEKKKK